MTATFESQKSTDERIDTSDLSLYIQREELSSDPNYLGSQDCSDSDGFYAGLTNEELDYTLDECEQHGLKMYVTKHRASIEKTTRKALALVNVYRIHDEYESMLHFFYAAK